MHVQDLMSHPVTSIHVNDTLNVAAQRMWDRDCGALPVVNDEGKLTGMVTDRDICMAAYTQGRPLDEILVNSAMAHHPVFARAEQPVSELLQLMTEHQLRRIPVIDDDGFPIGIISLNDLAIESAQPDTPLKHATQKIAHTLAAICERRKSKQNAA